MGIRAAAVGYWGFAEALDLTNLQLDQWNLTMKKILFLFTILPFCLFAQDFSKKEVKRMKPILKRSTVKVRNFDEKAMVSVERLNNSSMEGFLENALFMAGFNVVSNDVAKSSVNMSNPLNEHNKDIELSSSIQYNSIYLITVSGTMNACFGRCMECVYSCSARIVDLANDGTLVGTFKFSGTMGYVACPDDVANALAFKLLEASENQ